MAKLEFEKEPTIVEYSEQQGMWHYNLGFEALCSNGYEPIVAGPRMHVCEMMNKVHKEEGNKVLSLKQAWTLVDKYAGGYDDVRMIMLRK